MVGHAEAEVAAAIADIELNTTPSYRAPEMVAVRIGTVTGSIKSDIWVSNYTDTACATLPVPHCLCYAACATLPVPHCLCYTGRERVREAQGD